MKSKKYIFGILLLVIGGLTYYINSDYFNGSTEKANPFFAIPARTSAFVAVNDINELSQKIDSLSYNASLEESKVFSLFKKQLQSIDTILSSYTINAEQLLFSINNTGSSNLEFLSIVSLNELIPAKQILSKLKENNFTFSEYKYQSQKIYSVSNKKGLVYSFSVFENLLLISKNAPLVEESINGLINDNHKKFTDVFKLYSQKEGDIHLYIDIENSNDLKTTFFNTVFLNQLNGYQQKALWSHSAIHLNDNTIDYKTIYHRKQKQVSSVKYVANNDAIDFTLDMFLPNNTAYFNATKSKDNRAFKSNKISYNYFESWLAEEYAYFCLETFDENYMKRAGLVLKAKNIDTAKVNLYLLNKEMSPVDHFEALAIYKMNVDAVSKLFPNQLFSLENPFFAFIGKYVVFANDKTVLRTCFQKFKSNQFLKSDLTFQKFIKNKNNSASTLVYTNPQRWASTLNYFFNKDIITNRFGKSKLEIFSTDSTIFGIGTIDFDIQKTNKTSKLWELALDTISVYKPQIVTNAGNQKKEIFTQDISNKIYLINSSGNIVFKKQIAESIMSEVFQIDYFKSGKLQYVFNTKSYIYIIDRKGRMLDGFPLKLPAEASNAMLVVNYDNEKKYRYFIACKNNNIYGYEANGKPLEAWSPLGNYGKTTNKIQHAEFAGKDYIYFNNQKGTFYAFNRRGESRFEPINLSAKFSKAFEKTKNGFINMGEGSVYKLDLKGKTSVKILGDSFYSAFADYPEKNAFAISNKNEFRVAKSKWTVSGKRKLNDEPVSIQKLIFEKDIWFLVQGKRSVYLINELGDIHPDFPMLTSSETAFSKLLINKKNVMLFSEGKNLMVFELVLPQ